MLKRSKKGLSMIPGEKFNLGIQEFDNNLVETAILEQVGESEISAD